MATRADVRRIALSLPAAEEEVGRFAFSVRRKGKLKGFAWVWLERVDPKKPRVPQPSVVALRVASLAEKERLIALNPAKFFTEPHYYGFPAILVRLPAVTARELKPLITEAWRCQASKDLIAMMSTPRVRSSALKVTRHRPDSERTVRNVRRSVLPAGCLTVALLIGCGHTHPPDPLHDVDIVASDGVVLKGSYYSPGKAGPGIILIHQCNKDRHAWDTLTSDLTGAGFHVLTFDQRGFGSTGGRADQQQAVADADAAFAYLAAKKDVDKTRIATGGASCGVTFAAALAARRPEVRALLLLSGWADDASRKYMAATPSLPVFGAADDYRSDGDDIRQAVAASRHPASTARIFSGSAHGVGMFDAHPDLKPSIVTWLRAQLSTDAQRSVP